MLKKNRFIKLTNYDDGNIVFLDPEEITEIAGLSKTEKYVARTRIITKAKTIYLIKELPEKIHTMILTKK
jgi:hypothetical protein